ncbi:MAG TPA: PLP-dependent aminotransferase family protein [Pirellulales bacterium]|nr:PLP-dependent aminotransferase family protein [Pirellulales bacterium]
MLRHVYRPNSPAPAREMPHPGRFSQRASRAGGQPISELMHQALARPNLVSLAAGFVDQQSLPVEPVREAMAALLEEPLEARAALQYGTTLGFAPLRERVLAELLAADGQTVAETGLSADRLILTAGSNELLHLVTDTLCDPGDLVLCTAPTYFVYSGILKNLGVGSYGVASDAQGLIPEALDEALARLDRRQELSRVKALYIVSYFDNPRGVTLVGDRRAAVVEIVRRWSQQAGHVIYIIDDMAYRELRYAGPDLPSLRRYDEAGDTVITTHTFSKSLSPGLRVGYGLMPKPVLDAVCDQKGNINFGSPNFNQHLVAKLLDAGRWWPHVERLREAYRPKLAAMLAAAEEHLGPIEGVSWVQPEGGLYVWVELPSHCDAGPNGKLFDLALAEGVLYVPGEFCFPGEGTEVRANSMRLSFGVQPSERIHLGMAALARAIVKATD